MICSQAQNQKDTLHDEIGLCAQIVHTILSSISNTKRSWPYVFTYNSRIFFSSTYKFCISTPILKLEIMIFAIVHGNCKNCYFKFVEKTLSTIMDCNTCKDESKHPLGTRCIDVCNYVVHANLLTFHIIDNTYYHNNRI